jgi:hypothetical protein
MTGTISLAIAARMIDVSNPTTRPTRPRLTSRPSSCDHPVMRSPMSASFPWHPDGATAETLDPFHESRIDLAAEGPLDEFHRFVGGDPQATDKLGGKPDFFHRRGNRFAPAVHEHGIDPRHFHEDDVAQQLLITRSGSSIALPPTLMRKGLPAEMLQVGQCLHQDGGLFDLLLENGSHWKKRKRA